MAEDEAQNNIGYSFRVAHSDDEQSFQCWEGLSMFLILTSSALDRGLADELNKTKRRVWYVDEDDDGKEKEIEVLSKNQASFKEELEKNKEFYEQIIDEAADKIESFIKKTNSNNQIQ